MSYSSSADIANFLLKARNDHVQWNVGSTPPLENLDDVYAVQDLITSKLGADIRAWKTSPLDDGSAAAVHVVRPQGGPEDCAELGLRRVLSASWDTVKRAVRSS